MVQAEIWTVGRLLQWTTEYLGQHGADSPRLDAELLLAEARNCQRIDLYTQFESVADPTVKAAFRELVRRRAEGVPVAYLLGRREFYSLRFRVTPKVLIPRPETEFVVVTLLDLVRCYETNSTLQIADVGTGSGILAICAAREIVTAQITATDTSQAALAVARANAEDHGVLDRIRFLSSDLLSQAPLGQRFDFIVSNPPYVGRDEWEQLAREVREHEPREALDGGPNGTSVIRPLVGQAAERLAPGGWLLCEISPTIEAKVQQLVQAQEAFEQISTVSDLAQLPRVLVARKRST
jgi:release factor glutamine methyltransferase